MNQQFARRQSVRFASSLTSRNRSPERFPLLEQLEARRLFSVPANFAETQIAAGLARPVSMSIAPDGRIFVAEQGGKVKLIKQGQTSTFLTLNNVLDSNEQGLLAVTFDPDFATNKHVYLYYTVQGTTARNRIARVTANGDVADPSTLTTIFDLDPLSAGAHMGGGLGFGLDGKLYITTGDNTTSSNSQSMSTTKGKVLRINKDGTIPTDNPFYANTSGINKAIWALGLRNPSTMDFHRTSGRFFINDVGQQAWEEINEGAAGSNYGWPGIEGKRTTQPAPSGYRDPWYAYKWGFGDPLREGCAISAGTFYDPVTFTFPSGYQNSYFYADFCMGVINRVDTNTAAVSAFASGFSYIVDLDVDAQGNLYVLDRREYKTDGSSTAAIIKRISYTGARAPTIDVQPQSQTVAQGTSVTFSVQVTASPAPSYQWTRNGQDIPGATAAQYRIASVSAADNGAVFRVRVSNGIGSPVTSNAATLTVDNNDAPVGTITAPTASTTYIAGDQIAFAGTGTDAQDGTLPASAFTWSVDLHHNTHMHPFMAPTSGIKSGSFTIPTTGETDHDVFYRVHLTVVDSKNVTHTSHVDVQPRKSTFQLGSNVAGINLLLDGQQKSTPQTITGVIGMQRTLEAPLTQVIGSAVYEFTGWSDGGARVRTFSTPATATSFVANYRLSDVQQTNLSSLNWTSATSPYSGVKKDQTTSGGPIRVGGVTYATGLGVHSPSSVTYNLGGQYSRFTSYVGIDDAVGDGATDGSAVFEVWVDGVLKKSSARLTGAMGAELLDVDITGAQTLRLVTTTGGDGDYKDHADWADAKLYARPTATKPLVAVVAGTASVTEGSTGRGSFAIQRDVASAQPLTVSYSVSGTATAGTDYQSLTGTATIPAGATEILVYVDTVDDSIFEGNETVVLSIGSNTAYTTGSPSAATVTIADNDQPSTGQSTYLSDLNWTAATSPYGGARKNLATSGNPLRIGGTTYARGIGVHSLSSVTYNLGGQYSRFTSYVGIDDAVGDGATDGSAVFEVWVDGVLRKSSARLTGAMGAELLDVDVSGAQSLRLVTTVGGDSDYKDHTDWADAKLFGGSVVAKPVVSVAVEAASVGEATTNRGMFWVRRDAIADQPLMVNYTVAGTATAGTDYTALPGSVTIPAGAIGARVYVQPINDAVSEGNETVTLTVTGAAGYALGSPTTGTVTIVDDEGAPVGQSTYLSDLNWMAASSPYSGIKKDQTSIGGPIRIGGVTYAKGLGVHSPSSVTYALGGQYSRFTSYVGIDDVVGSDTTDGSAGFEVWVDGVLKKSSTRRTGADPAEFLDVDITGAQTLRLVTTTGGDGDYKDHADWGDAKLAR